MDGRSRSKQRKLNDDQVREVRLLRDLGVSPGRLHARWGVSPATIAGIIRGGIYRDVPGGTQGRPAGMSMSLSGNRANRSGRFEDVVCEDCLTTLTTQEVLSTPPGGDLVCSADRAERRDMGSADVMFHAAMSDPASVLGEGLASLLAGGITWGAPIMPDVADKAEKYDALVAMGVLESLGITE